MLDAAAMTLAANIITLRCIGYQTFAEYVLERRLGAEQIAAALLRNSVSKARKFDVAVVMLAGVSGRWRSGREGFTNKPEMGIARAALAQANERNERAALNRAKRRAVEIVDRDWRRIEHLAAKIAEGADQREHQHVERKGNPTDGNRRVDHVVEHFASA